MWIVSRIRVAFADEYGSDRLRQEGHMSRGVPRRVDHRDTTRDRDGAPVYSCGYTRYTDQMRYCAVGSISWA
jgi:hypothetical protein